MNIRIIVGLFFLSGIGFLQADTITIKNKSDFDIYGAVYYFDKKKAERTSEIKLIPANESQEFERPAFSLLGPSRYIAFSFNKDDLRENLTSSEFHLIGNTTIGTEQGSTFYITFDRGELRGFNILEWNIQEPLKTKIGWVVDAIDNLTLGQVRREYQNDPFANLDVWVRDSTDLPVKEYQYQSARLPKVKAALEKLLDMQLNANEIPKIAFCASGGGYRSMLATAGSVSGAEDILDGSYYFSALSGGAWFLGPWQQSGQRPLQFTASLPEKITRDFFNAPIDLSKLLTSLLNRFAFKQPISVVNLFGRLLALSILAGIENGPFNVYVHDQAKALKNGNKIFPIYAAIATKLPYQWIEFTPYEMGGDYFGGYIPVWTFGSPFLDGKRVYYTPPFHLHYLLAIVGSAFAARLSDTLNVLTRSIPIKPLQQAVLQGADILDIGRYRVAAAKVFNWTYGMQGLPRAQQELIRIVDAGISYNLPLEALMRRKANIIIILDNSASAATGKELQKAEEALKSRGYKLPPIDYNGIENKVVSVFKDPTDPKVPVLIYLPLVKNAHYPFDPKTCVNSWCSTFTLSYPLDKSQLLMGLTYKNMMDAKPVIINEIRDYILARRK